MNAKTIHSSDQASVRPILHQLYIPPADSHKGNNGKVLIIGGSSLFHSASLWSAEIASHFVDMVHYASTKENNQIFINLKSLFHNGIVVQQKDIPAYVEEDDAILIGPGMVRKSITNDEVSITNDEDVLSIKDEAEYARALTYYLLTTYPQKRFVIDAGALQMIDPDVLKSLSEPAIITPHKGEFERVFGISLTGKTSDEIAAFVKEKAKAYSCVILLKAIQDYISDGEEAYIVRGGNQGLTKGGSGDVLAGLTVALRSGSLAMASAVSASYLIKSASDALRKDKGYWYNMTNIIDTIPRILRQNVLS